MKSKKSEFAVRRYRETDKESCRSLWRELVEWHREIYADATIGGEHPEDYFDKYLAKIGANRIWVAVNAKSVVGFSGLVIESEEAKMDPIVVAKAFRDKGAGKQLARTLINEAKKLGAKYLNVEPVARNAEAIRFYHELGFVNVGMVQLFIDFSGKKWTKTFKMHELQFDY